MHLRRQNLRVVMKTAWRWAGNSISIEACSFHSWSVFSRDEGVRVIVTEYLTGALFLLSNYDVCICDECFYVCVKISMYEWFYICTVVSMYAKAPGKEGYAVLDSGGVRSVVIILHGS